MKFTVEDLKHVAGELRSLAVRGHGRLSAMLHRRQPDLCLLIDDVAIDPRCVQVHRFCTMFCALALDHAQDMVGHALPRYPVATIQEVMCLIAQGQEAQIGRRACAARGRIRRHVLMDGEFDEGDTAWLCLTIAAFLFVMEKSLGQERRA
jgi:hypothetical protein